MILNKWNVHKYGWKCEFNCRFSVCNYNFNNRDIITTKTETNTSTIITCESGSITVIMFNPINICGMNLKPNAQKQCLTILQTHR